MKKTFESFGDLEYMTQETKTSSSALSAALTSIADRLMEPEACSEALKQLEAALKAAYPDNLLCQDENKHLMRPVISGLKACLTLPESEMDTILATNQLIYEMMPDIAKHPSTLQLEMAALIPTFI